MLLLFSSTELLREGLNNYAHCETNHIRLAVNLVVIIAVNLQTFYLRAQGTYAENKSMRKTVGAYVMF